VRFVLGCIFGMLRLMGCMSICSFCSGFVAIGIVVCSTVWRLRVLQLFVQSWFCFTTVCQNAPKHRSAFSCSHSAPRNALPLDVWLRFIGRKVAMLFCLRFGFEESFLFQVAAD
jgi:hypothetical protein